MPSAGSGGACCGGAVSATASPRPAPSTRRPVAAHPAHLPSLYTRASGRRHPRWEPDAVIPLVRIGAGGAGRPASLPRQDWGALQSTTNLPQGNELSDSYDEKLRAISQLAF